MQIFSRSHTPYSYRTNVRRAHFGFTLIELLISASIIGIVSTIVLVKHGSFDSTVLLKSTAYEVALALREAQVKSVSVARNSTDFDFPYGITFSPDSKIYTAFRYTDSDSNNFPYYDIAEPSPFAEDVQSFTIGRTMQVGDVCVVVGGVENCSTPTRLDISFRRPEFRALFYADGYGTQPNIESARIKINSVGGSNTFVVEISALGQISVYNE